MEYTMVDSEKEYSIDNSGESSSSSSSSSDDDDSFLPIENVSRIMKKALPPDAVITQEAKEMVQECVSEFVSFITGEASGKCLRENRMTLNGDDVLWAIWSLEFNSYVEPLMVYLQKFRDYVKGNNGIEDHLLMMSEEKEVHNLADNNYMNNNIPGRQAVYSSNALEVIINKMNNNHININNNNNNNSNNVNINNTHTV